LNDLIIHPGDPTPSDHLRVRCRELGLPVWQWDATEALIVQPHGWGQADEWLMAPRLGELLASAHSAWLMADEPTRVEVIPGAWIIPVPELQADHTTSMNAVMVLTPEVTQSDRFATIADSAGLEPGAARTHIASIARHATRDVESISKTTGWMMADLRQRSEDTHTIDSFSQQLVDTYEQMSLLYQIAESMNRSTDPHGFVTMVCDLLLKTLDFEWIAVRFTSLTSLGRTIANDLVLVGKIPCSHTRYDRLAGELTTTAGIAERPMVLDRDDSELASLVRSEVFVNPLICDNDLAGLILAGNKGGHDPDVSTVDMQLISATADYMSAFLHNSALYNEQRTMFLGIIKALSASIDAKDQYTRGHSERVAHLASELATAIGMNEDQSERVRLAGILHDMGKIGVPEAVLLKPGRLTDEEFNAIKLHPTIGYNILKDIDALEDVLPGVLYHHERWDGKGYPQGLKGGDIPLMGRLLAVADAFDAMSSDRAYRPRISREKVLMEMRGGAGTQWDRELVKVFLTLDLGKYDAMIERHAAQQSQAAA